MLALQLAQLILKNGYAAKQLLTARLLVCHQTSPFDL